MGDTLDITYGAEKITAEVSQGTFRATELKKIATADGPLATYDPGLVNTASCKSAITFIDGDVGILEYRGYPIEQLAEKSTFLEVAYLLIHGELPTADQLRGWESEVNHHRLVHENAAQVIDSLRYDAHPMAKLMSGVASMQTFYPEARNIHDPASRHENIVRLLGKMPTLAAWAYRLSVGMRWIYPSDELGYCENFLAMLFQMQERSYRADPRLVHRSRCCSSFTPTTNRTARRTSSGPSRRPGTTSTPPAVPASAPSSGRCTAVRTKRSSRCSGRSARSTASPSSSRA